jgi:capsular exopolysaccharide synthesis family protein
MATREDLRVIMVTSSLSGEGKSTTSANLAVALAQSGRKVVLVSADLRKPRVARFLHVNEPRGLSDILAGTVDDPWTLMPDPGVTNLRVLGSGPSPKNPAELLSGPRCATLVDGLRTVADLVVIDTPPVLAVADASILSGVADGVILLVDGEHTKRSAISQTRMQLETAGARILGVVYNNYDANQAHGYPFHYYGSGYDAQPSNGANGSSGSDDASGRNRSGGKRTRRASSLVGFAHGTNAN